MNKKIELFLIKTGVWIYNPTNKNLIRILDVITDYTRYRINLKKRICKWFGHKYTMLDLWECGNGCGPHILSDCDRCGESKYLDFKKTGVTK